MIEFLTIVLAGSFLSGVVIFAVAIAAVHFKYVRFTDLSQKAETATSNTKNPPGVTLIYSRDLGALYASEFLTIVGRTNADISLPVRGRTNVVMGAFQVTNVGSASVSVEQELQYG